MAFLGFPELSNGGTTSSPVICQQLIGATPPKRLSSQAVSAARVPPIGPNELWRERHYGDGEIDLKKRSVWKKIHQFEEQK